MTLPHKCGPNWVPDWLYDEPQFDCCCIEHDMAYVNKTGKVKADWAMLKCMWEQAGKESGLGWKLRAYVQAILSYLLVVGLPYSYVVYYLNK